MMDRRGFLGRMLAGLSAAGLWGRVDATEVEATELTEVAATPEAEEPTPPTPAGVDAVLVTEDGEVHISVISVEMRTETVQGNGLRPRFAVPGLQCLELRGYVAGGGPVCLPCSGDLRVKTPDGGVLHGDAFITDFSRSWGGCVEIGIQSTGMVTRVLA